MRHYPETTFRENPILCFRSFLRLALVIEGVLRDYTDQGVAFEDDEQVAPEENWDHIGELDDEGIALDNMIEMMPIVDTPQYPDTLHELIHGLAANCLYYV